MIRKPRDGRFVGTSNKGVATLLANETKTLERFGAVVETVTNEQAESQRRLGNVEIQGISWLPINASIMSSPSSSS